ncbi:MAG: rod shape-determining protein RodA [Pseudomonadota bacterium]
MTTSIAMNQGKSMEVNRNFVTRLHIDGPLVGGIAVLAMLGSVVLYSAADQSTSLLFKQSVRLGIGFVAMVVIAQFSPRQLLRLSPFVYAVGIVLLIIVFFIGTGRGASRWLDLGFIRFQPSEIMKLAVPLMVARYLYDKVLPANLLHTIVSLALVLIPCALIVEQPDLGTSILVGAAGLFVIFFAGIQWRWILLAGGLGLAAAPVAWLFLHDYQRERILTLLDPDKDPLGAGYHIIQATIAVGSGGISGKGWLNGTQSHLQFLPERATDFIFAVYCEEFGLMGVVIMMSAYGLILSRGLSIALNAQDTFGRLVSASITMTFFIYIFVNMGMVTGQLPVVGVPLPLVSYGGTSLVTIMAGFGILMSVQTHRRFISIS